MDVNTFISRLEKVKRRGDNKWLACCPAHEDSDPSLSITETPTGKLLVKCWAGCSALDIVQSMGLTLSDLFPDDYNEHPMAFAQKEMAAKRHRQGELIRVKEYLTIITANLKAGRPVSESEIEKARQYRKMLKEVGHKMV